MKFGIAVFPPKNVQDEANSHRKRFDPHYNLIQPHLTVREAEEWDDSKREQAIRHLEETTAQIRPFGAKLNRFSSFYPVTNTIYMALEDPQPFEELYKRVCSGVLQEEGKQYTYHPHLTIGQLLGNDEMHDVLSSLRPIPLDLSFTVDRLHLLYQTDNGAWTAHQTFLLGK
ncbi:2'-5' RNA ligase family protein [Paenibacillus thermotolerans]|uniref:2'-5' RNA ligase family protein n=1 Tax=Paenibacillus thermotolerans TaxID=3027807 RepID=UPI002367BE7C|nr:MULTISPECIES: 2'-5' RNA ligase family protein [unclassified Paenibacillus]